jgi:hypothetical protein
MAPSSEQLWLFLEPVNLAITSAAIFHLFRNRLQRTYPILTLFLMFDAVVNALSLGFILEGNEKAYCQVFSAASYVVPVTCFHLCPDIFKELFNRYPGFVPARKRQLTSFAFAGLGAAATSATTALFSLTKIIECKPTIVVELGLVISFGCGIFLLAMLRSTAHLRIAIPRNTRILAPVIAFELIQQAILGAVAIYLSLRHLENAVDRINVIEALLLIGTRSFIRKLARSEPAPHTLTMEERARGNEYISRLGELARQGGRSWQR